MIIKTLQVGELGTNCYLVGDNAGACAVIDPGGDAPLILDAAARLGWEIQAILLTHGHFDHTMALPELMQAVPSAAVYIHRDDCTTPGAPRPMTFAPPPGCRFYGEGDTVTVGGLTFEVLHTPGHTRGSVTLKAGDCLFTGDTLFQESCGRTDFEGGSYEDMMRSLRRLGELEGDYRVLPGHMGASALSAERRGNYYLRSAMGGR